MEDAGIDCFLQKDDGDLLSYLWGRFCTKIFRVAIMVLRGGPLYQTCQGDYSLMDRERLSVISLAWLRPA